MFHHPLVRAVAYEAQLKSDRAELHRRVASAIEQSSAGSLDENAALIAEHLEAAGDLHTAFDWHMRAGAWANNRDSAAARISWERARQVADALPDDYPDRTSMRIAPRATLCASDWRVHADDSGIRFEELGELCALAGDKTPLAIGIMGPMALHAQRGEVHEAQRLASELMALLDSIGDPSLTAQAAFGAIATKAQAGEMGEVIAVGTGHHRLDRRRSHEGQPHCGIGACGGTGNARARSIVVRPSRVARGPRRCRCVRRTRRRTADPRRDRVT